MLYDKKNKFKVAMLQFHFQFYKTIVPVLIILGFIMRIKQIKKKACKENKDQCINKILCMTCKTVSNEFGD